MKNCAKVCKNPQIELDNLVDLEKCKLLQNAPTLAIVAVHSADNEPPKVLKSKEVYNRSSQFYSKHGRARLRADHRANFSKPVLGC